MEVTKFIRIAGGNYNEKEKRPEYFDDELIFYRSNFLSKKNPEYHGLKKIPTLMLHQVKIKIKAKNLKLK